MNQVDNLKQSRSVLLDMFRSLVIVLLLIGHIGSWLSISWVDKFYINLGDLYVAHLHQFSVTLFLILSGLVIGLKYGNCKIDYLGFIKKRLIKIYSVYVPSFIIGLLIFFTLSRVAYNATLTDFMCSLVGFCSFINRFGGIFIETSWFIGLIVVLYLLFPIISRYMKDHPHLTIITLLLFSIFSLSIGQALFIVPIYALVFLFPLSRIFEFGLGVYLVRLIKPKAWSYMNKYKQTGNIFNWVARISFPLFLVHHPLRFVLLRLDQLGTPLFVAVTVYVGISVLVSWLVLKLSEQIVAMKIWGRQAY
ncbi:MAG: acyltransferase family protein [Patescibacteria group bacterium]